MSGPKNENALQEAIRKAVKKYVEDNEDYTFDYDASIYVRLGGVQVNHLLKKK